MLPIIPIPLPTPWSGLGPAFAYLIPQEPVTLVDAGLGTPEAKQAFLAALDAHKLKVTDIRRVLATHAHVDHIGLAGWIQAEAGAELWIHPLEAGKLYRTDWWQAGLAQFLRECGLAESVATTFGPTQVKRLGRAITPFHEWRYLREGARIPFADGELTVIHTPGHALGHVSFLEEATGRLIGGDILLEGQIPNPLIESLPPVALRTADGDLRPEADLPSSAALPAKADLPSDAVLPAHADLPAGAPEWDRLLPVPYAPYRAQTVRQLWATLDRIAGLPIRAVLPGHGSQITDVAKVIRYYQGRRARKLERLRSRLTEPQTALQLMKAIFPRLGHADLQLGLSDVVGHLDWLLWKGQVSVEPGPTGLRYRLQ
jgi:glyoxylase-like metal-dependent hydrolase (beta-lactamase superfamily II)